MAIPSGEIFLLKNVPLVATYEHTIDFKDRDEQFAYMRSFVKHGLTEYTYIRKDREYIAVDLPIATTDDINYMIFRCADDERLYYAFVTNKVFNNPNNTYIYYQIDVLQTYMFDYKWNASYIRQAHVDRWTAEHKPIYSKTDEGLDYGSDYSVESAYRLSQSSALRWLLVSMKEAGEMTEEGAAVVDGIGVAPSPFACYLVPMSLKLQTNGKPYRVFSETLQSYVADYETLLYGLRNSALGNYIQSITLLSYNPFIASDFIDDGNVRISFSTIAGVDIALTSFDIPLSHPFMVIREAPIALLKGAQRLARAAWDEGLDASLPLADQWDEVKKNPFTTKRDKRFESKLLCAPYRYNLLTDWRNSPVIIKNEYMPNTDIDVMFSFGLSYNAPFRFWIKDYKKDPEGRYTSLLQPIGLEFPVISDAYYTYMLENKNTIHTNIVNGAIAAGAGVVSGAVGGGLAGAAMGVLHGAVSVSAQIASENAKQKDLRAVPDSVINSVDSSFNVNDNNTEVCFYRMRICCENEAILAEIFNMYGYKVHRVDVPNTRSRTRFNYIQTLGANITGSFNQADLLRIKEIFDTGVTIWHYNDKNFKPLDYTLENIEVNLV